MMSERHDPDEASIRRCFAMIGQCDSADPRHRLAREKLVELHLPLVRYLAVRFAGRGEPVDDLVQIGTVGLLQAIDCFIPRGERFSAAAAASIVGEIKRHFRERVSMVMVPPRLQELGESLATAIGDLTDRLGRSPTITELAEELDVVPDDLISAMESRRVSAPVPIDAPQGPSGLTLADTLIDPGDELEHVELRNALVPALSKLTERQRVLVTLRFMQSKTQTEIAATLGISQVHVSRLLSKTLDELRQNLPDVRTGT
jgi:RNA polymerase sigma-B factor